MTKIEKRRSTLACAMLIWVALWSCLGVALAVEEGHVVGWPPELAAEFAETERAPRDAAGGVDGIRNGAFGFHTLDDRSAWWQVDLGVSSKLERVDIYNRNDICDRARTVTVMLSDNGADWNEAYRHDGRVFSPGADGGPLSVPLHGAQARFVRLQLTEKNYLHLDEIEVFSAVDPSRNIALGRPASQSSTSPWSSLQGPVLAVREGERWQQQAGGIEKTLRYVLDETGDLGIPLRAELDALALTGVVNERDWMVLATKAFSARHRLRSARERLEAINLPALRRGVDHLTRTYPDQYPNGPDHIARLEATSKALPRISKGLEQGRAEALKEAEALVALKRTVMLANPLLDFDRLLLVRRAVSGSGLGLPANWTGNCAIASTGYDNEIATLSIAEPETALAMLFKPDDTRFVGDVDLDSDAGKMAFSMPGTHGRWQVWEMAADGSGLHQVTPGEEPDVDNYDPCYLPDGRIIYGSTALMHGVPCVNGSANVANLFLLDPATVSIRQLCYDQDHDWCPTVLNNGRVLYLRWEYTDLPHSNSRILFHMNPDGTGQAEYYGSNSYFPNAFFFARPIPNHPTKVVGIATGHHGETRSGRLLILDPEQGRQEADGVTQEIPGWGKVVEPLIKDQLVAGVWPQFLHPYPLSENYFLVSAKMSPASLWGIYLVDTFDNMTLIKEIEGSALFEPLPFRATPRPPVIAEKVLPDRKDATVQIVDIHRGPGLAGIPRGVVKNLRLFTYVYGYRGMGGLRGTIGMDGPWDIRRVLGTVPVESDGSALFKVPANTPIAVQPLDAEGKALQLMRSWFTAMPAETLSCVGCHEKQNESPPSKATIAARRAPSEIESWHGPTRGFSFEREVQPVLDEHCVSCHNGESREGKQQIISLSGKDSITDWGSQIPGSTTTDIGGKFSVSYAELHRFVRRPGIESDIRLLTPMDFHADTTELVQMLRKGHHGVDLDHEAWDRIVTWIDLNAPYFGTWSEILGKERVAPIAERERELRLKYAGVDVDFEAIPEMPAKAVKPVALHAVATERSPDATAPGWPFSPEEAKRRQADYVDKTLTFALDENTNIEMVYIPVGAFVMGDAVGEPDEAPTTRVEIEKPFWMGRIEITNTQFAAFDAAHDSRVESKHDYQFGVHGFPLNTPQQPVVRVSWERAMAFCQWLSEKTGETFALPTEAQWEYACRAGAATPFSYGGPDDDFSQFGNLGDATLKGFANNPYTLFDPYPNPNRYDDWVPKDERFNDGSFVTTDAGSYQANAWGLHDMHGNAWEWTRSAYRPYPYVDNDGRNETDPAQKRVARGGSWYDRPKRCRSAFRLAYHRYQSVFNVGFRVVLEFDGSPARLAKAAKADGGMQVATQ